MNSTDSHDLIPPLREQDHVQGSINAAIVLMKYCDYQCSECGQAHRIVQNLQRQLGKQLCYIFRHFPLPHHPQALRAAEAAEAAHAQEKFWQMHNILFEQQQALEDADLVECAAALNLDIPRFLQELSTRVHIERIQADIESGCSNGVEEAPTFFINVRHRGTQNLEALLLVLCQINREQP